MATSGGRPADRATSSPGPAVADLNGDRIADILWRNASGGSNVLWLHGKATAQRAVATVSDSHWHVAKASDFDGDGKADVPWRNKATGGNEL